MRLDRCLRCLAGMRVVKGHNRGAVGPSEAGRGAHSPVRCRMGKESSPVKVSPAQSVRFVEKHNPYTQPSAKQLLDNEHPLQPTSEVHPSPKINMPRSTSFRQTLQRLRTV